QLVELPLDVRKVGDSSSSTSTKTKGTSYEVPFVLVQNTHRSFFVTPLFSSVKKGGLLHWNITPASKRSAWQGVGIKSRK
ncbi:MAG: hypothetical protein RR461_04760, partial [Angelakisella sp.]